MSPWRANAVEDAQSSRGSETSRAAFAGLAALGIGCWFIIGFPFGNHNESYYWVAQFQYGSLWDVLWSKRLAATPRPLGQSFAFLGWQLAGGSS